VCGRALRGKGGVGGGRWGGDRVDGKLWAARL